MPQIREFDAPALGIRPTETGISATAGGARRVQGAFNEAAAAQEESGQKMGRAIAGLAQVTDAIDKMQEHQEVSYGAAQLAKMHAEASAQWNDAAKKADPNDPTVGPKFLQEKLEPNLEKFESGFQTQGGQQWADARVAAFREHMTQKVTADQSAMAGQAIAVNLAKTKNELSATVRSDPTSINESLNIYESALEKLIQTSPTLTAVEASEARTKLMMQGKHEIITSAALGHIQQTGEIPAWTTDPKYAPYIKSVDLKNMQSAAKYYQRQNDLSDKATRQFEEHGAKLKFNAAINELELSTTDENGLPVVGPQHIKRLNEIVQQNPLGAALEPGRVRTMQEGLRASIERMNKAQPPAGPSREIRNDLLQRIDAGEVKDGAEIYAKSGEMTDGDFKYTMSTFRRAQTDEGRLTNRSIERFLKSVGPQIDKSNPLMGKLDNDGKQNVDRLRWDLTRKMGEYERTGKNPQDLVDPSKPDYMGSPSALEPYQKTMNQSIQDTARRLTGNKNLTGPGKDVTGISVEPAPPPKPLRKPGESAADYMKRIGM